MRVRVSLSSAANTAIRWFCQKVPRFGLGAPPLRSGRLTHNEILFDKTTESLCLRHWKETHGRASSRTCFQKATPKVIEKLLSRCTFTRKLFKVIHPDQKLQHGYFHITSWTFANLKKRSSSQCYFLQDQSFFSTLTPSKTIENRS